MTATPSPMHPIERKALEALASSAGPMALEALASSAGLSIDQARRAVEWLRSKGLVSVEERSTPLVRLGPNGADAASRGLPENRAISALSALGGRARIGDVASSAGLTVQELNASLGRLVREGYVRVSSGQVELLLSAPYHPLAEELLRRLSSGALELGALGAQERDELENLSRRPGFLEVEERKSVVVRPLLQPRPALGAEAGAGGVGITQLTPDDIVSGRWRVEGLTRLDVSAPSPPVYPGRRHVITEYIRLVREVFVSMGFEEVTGRLLQLSFWNFDALFTPQDHPARELQDTFYVDMDPSHLEPPPDEVVRAVRAAHEGAMASGSRGWGQGWDPAEARRVVLRTHTTVLSVQALRALRDRPTVKVFAVGRVFRNEKVDPRHLVEFHQIEGIVRSPSANLRRLMWYISEFYGRIGFPDVKFWPTYFPYTEPSLQVMAKVGDRWLEMGGMGVFRPEVSRPLGVEGNVLAWGLGLERMIMVRHGIEDARQLYRNDLSWLRGIPSCRS